MNRGQFIYVKNAARVRTFDPRQIAFANTITREAQRAGAMQLRGEYAPFLLLVKRLRPRRILEIGLGAGGTLQAFCRIAHEQATVVNIDLPSGPFGGVADDADIERIRGYALPRQTLHLIRADSHDQATVPKARSCFDGEIDVLFIDGDHRYEGVRSDFENYAHLVRKGGIVGFHDIVPGPPESVGGVPQFWEEVKASHPGSLELVEDWRQRGYGIGLVKV